MIRIFTDGSCLGNPGPGGFGVIVCDDHNDFSTTYEIINAYQEREDYTTNNRMEMKAIIWAIKNYGIDEPIIYTDSSYCLNTLNKWMYNWRNNGWKRTKNKPVENLDLVMRCYALREKFNIHLEKIKGHSGNYYNELVDSLASGKISSYEVTKGRC